MAIYKSDIVDINLESGSIHRSFMKHSIGTADQAADRFGIRAFRNGEAVDLSGASCYGYFRDPQGNNIALTSNGAVDGNVAYVTLPQACYNYEGNFTLTIKLLVTGVTSTVRIIDGVVDNTNTGSAVAPTGAVPTYSEILSQYDDMVAATAVANGAIATTFNAATVYPAGSYVINDGALYRITADHAANVTWANTSKVATNFGAEVTALKSAFSAIDGVEFLPFITGHYIITKNATVDITDIRDNSSLGYCIVDCQAGDTFVIKGVGAGSGRLWCFIDSSGNNLAPGPAASNKSMNFKTITAPTNAVKCVINCMIDRTYIAFKGRLTVEVIEELKDKYDQEISDIIDYSNILRLETIKVNSKEISKWFTNYITDVPSGNLYACVVKTENANNSTEIMAIRSNYTDNTYESITITELNKLYKLKTNKTVSSITIAVYMRDSTAGSASDSSFTYFIEKENGIHHEIEVAKYSSNYPEEVQSEMDDTIKNHVAVYQRGRVGYIMLTDLHVDYTTDAYDLKYQSEQIKMVCDLANNADIDFVCLGGDYVWGNQALKENTLKWMRWIIEQFKACTKPIIVCKGNHDYNRGTGQEEITTGEFYTLLQAPFRRNEFVYDEGSENEELYFYYDIPSKKTRVIAYDSYRVPDADRQIQWVCEQALTKQSGWSYIFVMHVPLNNLYNTAGMDWVAAHGGVLENIIHALNTRGTYTGTAGSYSVNVDFTEWTSYVICVSTGHEHTDLVTEDENTDCFFTTTGCATTYGTQGVFNDPTVLPDGSQITGRNKMDYTQKNKYLFDVFSVTRDSITRTRFGNGVDKTLARSE